MRLIKLTFSILLCPIFFLRHLFIIILSLFTPIYSSFDFSNRKPYLSHVLDPIVTTLLIVAISLWYDVTHATDYSWTQKSGAVAVLAGFYIIFYDDKWLDGKPDTLGKRAGFVLTTVGTLIWAYGIALLSMIFKKV